MVEIYILVGILFIIAIGAMDILILLKKRNDLGGHEEKINKILKVSDEILSPKK